LVVVSHQKFFSVWIWSIYDWWDYQSVKVHAMKPKLTFHISLLNLVSFLLWGESGGAIYQILYRNNKMMKMEYDSCFITTRDTWAINKRFYYVNLVNRWNIKYETRITVDWLCDSDDYYNSCEQNADNYHCPKYNKRNHWHIGF
jgi:hypothetical protein